MAYKIICGGKLLKTSLNYVTFTSAKSIQVTHKHMTRSLSWLWYRHFDKGGAFKLVYGPNPFSQMMRAW
jgi:hypothetical protein